MVDTVVRIKYEQPSEDKALLQYKINNEQKDLVVASPIDDTDTISFKNFNNIFDSNYKNSKLIDNDIISSKILDLFEGVNSSIITFGQNNTGKTFTIFGDLVTAPSIELTNIDIKSSRTSLRSNSIRDDVDINDESNEIYKSDDNDIVNNNDDNINSNSTIFNEGLIQSISKKIFNKIDNIKETENIEFSISISFYEIFEEKIYDLLSPSKELISLKLKKVPSNHNNNMSLEIENLRQVYVDSYEELLSYIIESLSTKDLHSRKNLIFKINLEQVLIDDQILKFSSLILMDLASSDLINEKLPLNDDENNNNNTNNNIDNNQKFSLKETKKINSTMENLQSYINLLAETGTSPYQFNSQNNNDFNSILVDVFAILIEGNFNTLFFATISPLLENKDETFLTLRIAQQVKSISKNNNTIKNVKGLNSRKELELLKKDINLKENFYKSQIRLLEEQLKFIKSQNNLKKIDNKIEINSKRKSGLQEEIKFQERENRKLKKQVKTLAHLLTKANNSENLNELHNFSISPISPTNDDNTRELTNNSNSTSILNTEDQDLLLQTLLQKCEQVVDLQLSLDDEVNKGTVLQKQAEFAQFKGQTLETMNLKLLDQINLLEKDLQITLNENAIKSKEANHWKDVAQSRKSKIKSLETNVSNLQNRQYIEDMGARKPSTTSSSGNTLVQADDFEFLPSKSKHMNYTTSPRNHSDKRSSSYAASTTDRQSNESFATPTKSIKGIKRGLDLRVLQSSKDTLTIDEPNAETL